jgi:DNA polymerase III subunit epsilon
MIILGLDLEGMNEDITKGVNLEKDRITEVGVVAWDWEEQSPVRIISELIDEEDRLSITEENTAITGITDRALEKYGMKGEAITEFYEKLAEAISDSDAVMAHNGGGPTRPGKGYDYQMLKASFERHGIVMPGTPWIDTLTDCELPKDILQASRGARSMMALEYAHGFINPFPHRAVTDVLAMLKIFARYSIEDMLLYANSPEIELKANFSYPYTRGVGAEQAARMMEEFEAIKNAVKKSGFYFNPETKEWTKSIKKLSVERNPNMFDHIPCMISGVPQKTQDINSDDIPF